MLRDDEAELVAHGVLERTELDLLPVLVHRLLRCVDVYDRSTEGERVLEGRARPVADHHVRAQPRVDGAHVLLEDEPGLRREPAPEVRDELRQAADRHRVQAEDGLVPGGEEHVDELGADRALDERAVAPGRRDEHPACSAVVVSVPRLADLGEHGVELHAPVLDELLLPQAVSRLRRADLGDVVRPDAQHGVVRVECALAVRGMRAVHRVEEIDVVDGVLRSLEPQLVEIGQGHDEMRAIDAGEEDRANRAVADQEAPEPRVVEREPGIGRDPSSGTRCRGRARASSASTTGPMWGQSPAPSE